MNQPERIRRLADLIRDREYHEAEIASIDRETEELYLSCQHTTLDGQSALQSYPVNSFKTITDCAMCGLVCASVEYPTPKRGE